MTEQDREIQSLRRELDYLKQSETVCWYLQKNPRGTEYIHDIRALDRGLTELHNRVKNAERAAQRHMADAVLYRRRCEAMEIERKEEEENRFPLFDHSKNQHEKAPV